MRRYEGFDVEQDTCNRRPVLESYGAFPDDQHPPPVHSQSCASHLPVPIHIAVDLYLPELGTGL